MTLLLRPVVVIKLLNMTVLHSYMLPLNISLSRPYMFIIKGSDHGRHKISCLLSGYFLTRPVLIIKIHYFHLATASSIKVLLVRIIEIMITMSMCSSSGIVMMWLATFMEPWNFSWHHEYNLIMIIDVIVMYKCLLMKIMHQCYNAP